VSLDKQSANAPVLKKCKFLANKLSVFTADHASASVASSCTETVQGQLSRYIAEVEQSTADDALAFWAARKSSYNLLIPLAQTS